MRWYRNIYLGEVAAKKHFRVFRYINERKLRKNNPYLITLPSSEHNLVDLVAYNMVLKAPLGKYRNKALSYDDVFVLGIGYDKDDALNLLQKIILEVYEKTGDFDVWAYIEARDKDCPKKREEVEPS